MEATYVLLDADELGYTLKHRFVPYDRNAVIQSLADVHHPAADFIASFMRGEKIATKHSEPSV